MIRKSLNDPSLERHLSNLSPDGITWFSAGPRYREIQMRGVLIHGTRAVCQARANHGLGPVETHALGKGLLVAGVIAALLKDSGSIGLRIDGSGPAEGFSTEGIRLSSGNIRARGRLFINPFPPEAQNLDSPADLFGLGALTVTRIEGRSRPSIGSIPLRTGNLNKDVVHYFSESEQTRTAVDSGIYFTGEGAPFGAGVLLLQALPGAEDGFLAGMEGKLALLPPLGLWFAEGGTRDTLISTIFGEQETHRTAEADFTFDCPCSKPRFLKHLTSLDKASIEDILEKGPWPLETQCHYCASTYTFSREELAAATGRIAKS